jgi:threonine/homoserine/homoserine lactone efflux protein
MSFSRFLSKNWLTYSLVVAWILAFSVQQLGNFYGKMQKVQKWMNRIVGVLFIVIGIYYSWIMYL